MIVLALLASGASAGDGGGLVGWVESTQGTPVAGAVISIFGKGIGSSGFVTLSDSTGQFVLPRLPAGSYTLRALGTGHLPAPARRFTVLPDRDETFTVSLTPLDQAPAGGGATASPGDDATTAAREWRWLVRHKRRSVLEDRSEQELPGEAVWLADSLGIEDPLPRLVDLDGSVELLATPLGAFSPPDASVAGQGILRLSGRLAHGVSWSLGGLVTENQRTSWRMGAEFVLDPGEGHTLETGAGYGVGIARGFGGPEDVPIDPRGTGAMFLRSRLRLSEKVTASLGTRYSYVGFLEDANHLDAMLALEVETAPETVVHGSYASRTLAPGGDLLTISTRDSSPLITYAAIGDGLRASRTEHYALGVDQVVGPASLGARVFYEDTVDQLANLFEGDPATRSLRIFNLGPLTTRGVGLTLGRRFGDSVRGSVSYTYGRTHRGRALVGFWPRPAAASYQKADFHDVEAEVETFIDVTSTRLQAYCRLNTLDPDLDGRGRGGALANTRFDLQLTQGLPFMAPLTRAEWEVLVAFRNLFYERGEGATFDELVVLNPPKRVVGGIAVKF